MNQFLSSRYDEVIHRLALGIEPIDALGAKRLSYQLQVEEDGARFGLPRPPIERHASNLFALRYQPGVTTQRDLRFFDSSRKSYKPDDDRRRVVPRRLRIPMLTLADVEAQEEADVLVSNAPKNFRRRIRRPVFFPGAAYGLGSTSTGMRGCVTRADRPIRWTRVVAKFAGAVVGRAHGDDRGEFLLLIDAKVTIGSALPDPLIISVSVSFPALEPVPTPSNLPDLDPLWDLPLEILAAPGANDPVAAGIDLPSGYSGNVTRNVEFTLGKCLYKKFEIT